MPELARQPTQFTVTSQVQRIAVGAAGATVINTSSTATIWVGPNSTLAPGVGTPISPNTSVPWSSDGELWAVLGTDAASVTAGSAPAIVSYDITNWQPDPAVTATLAATAILNAGVLVIDNPVSLVPGTALYNVNPTMNFPAGVARFDVRRYRTLHLYSQWFFTAGTSPQLSLNWYDDPVAAVPPIQQDIVRYLPGQGWMAEVPVKAGYLQISVGTNGAAANLSLNVLASYRESTFRQSIVGGLSYLVSNIGANVLNGTSLVTTVPPWFGDVEVQVKFVCAGAVALPGWVAWDTVAGAWGGGVATNSWLQNGMENVWYNVIFGTTNVTYKGRYAMHGRGLQLEVFNNSGGLATVNITAVPVRAA